MYISILVLVILAFMWASTSKNLRVATQRADDAEKRVRDLEKLAKEVTEREDNTNRKFSRVCHQLKIEITWAKVASRELKKGFPGAGTAVWKKWNDLRDSGGMTELVNKVQIDEFGEVVPDVSEKPKLTNVDKLNKVLSSLTGMGYSLVEAQQAVQSFDSSVIENQSVPNLVRDALAWMVDPAKLP